MDGSARDRRTLGPFPSEAQAQMARGALAAHEIDATLDEGDDGWVVHVPADDLDAARSVLRPPEPAPRHSWVRLAVELAIGIVVAVGLYVAVVSWLAG